MYSARRTSRSRRRSPGSSGRARLAATQRRLVAAFDHTFATYWADPHFETFDPDQFVQATQASPGDAEVTLTPFQIEPYPFQRQILERSKSNVAGANPTTWSSPQREPARPSSPRSTTAAFGTAGPVPPVVRRPPRGDPRAEPHDVSPRPARRRLRRAVGRRRRPPSGSTSSPRSSRSPRTKPPRSTRHSSTW